jgi:hypothetical protein
MYLPMDILINQYNQDMQGGGARRRAAREKEQHRQRTVSSKAINGGRGGVGRATHGADCIAKVATSYISKSKNEGGGKQVQVRKCEGAHTRQTPAVPDQLRDRTVGKKRRCCRQFKRE